MSRPITPSRPFDTNRFMDLLKRAKGNRTGLQFSKECGITPQYLSRCLNGKFSAPPLPATLKKIAAVAANDVTYEDFLDAAGYDIEKYGGKVKASEAIQPGQKSSYPEDPSASFYVKEPSAMYNPNIIDFQYVDASRETSFVSPFIQDIPATPNKDSSFIPLATATIISALRQGGKKWSTKAGMAAGNSDLMVEIEGSKITEWLFRFFTTAPAKVPDQARMTRMASYYFAWLALLPHEKDSMWSYVTNSIELFDSFVLHPPLSLAMYVSVILIDTKTLSVIKEQVLETAAPKRDDLPSLINHE